MPAHEDVPDLKVLAPRHLDRRQLLQLGGAGALSLMVAGCGGSSGGGGGASTAKAKTVASTAKIEAGPLLLANWVDYSDPANYEAYTKAFGPKITIDGYGSNEELLAKLNAGGSAFDIVVPTG